MKRIDIKITYQCNNCCQFCVQGDKRKKHPDKTKGEIERILHSLCKDYGEVVLTGGDPLIHPDIIEIISMAKKNNFIVQIQTNGRMFAYKGFCKDAIRAGFDTAFISIHGHTAALHDTLTRSQGSFEQSIAGIKNLTYSGKKVITNTVINSLNYRFLPNIANLLIQFGVGQFQFAFPHILGSAWRNRKAIIPRKQQAVSYLKKALDIGFQYNRIVRVEAIPSCLLVGYEQCIVEPRLPETKVFDVHKIDNFNVWRQKEGKKKNQRCMRCRHYTTCEGPWREYPRYFGWKEFVPVV